ncbi:FtsK/SpoIIIE domain-containing protein [Actinoplanes sp. HUAS TT8]|uniref:FtsK/SpoIIIE domain-containing protein n=1 Tax=Actinoplanes sp. HUAS TT8 TaxID=3447453 RepID=UPI003F526F82
MHPERPIPFAAQPPAGPASAADSQQITRRNAPGDRLRTLIGLAPDGTPIHLDLKEAVDNGMGPHGLATPTAIRTIVHNLAATHTADEVSFVFLNVSVPTDLGRLPHTEAVVDTTRIPRLIEVLEGELIRRKRLLVAAGCSSHSQYLRHADSRPPMSALIVIGHAAHHPGLLELFRRIGRLGRARGIHLLLTGEAHDLAGYLSYRISLDAQGNGLLQPSPDRTPIPFHPRMIDADGFDASPPTHRIWLPPLDDSPTLDDLAGPIVTDSDHTPRFADETLHGTLQLPVALLDKPREHRRDTIWLPLPGNVAVVGGPGSGRTTFLRTVTAALALSHSAPNTRLVLAEQAPYQRIPLVHGRLGRPDTMRDLYARLDVPSGDTVVLVDDWPEFWATHPHWHDLLAEIARRGPSRGVHLVATATHWSDFDPRLTDHFASRLELRLADPAESAISPAAAATVPEHQPGRGLVDAPSGPLHFVTARPELSSTSHDALIAALSTDHCAECGFTYGSVSAADLPARLRSAGALYASALLATPDLRRRPSPEVWSPLEYTCHVRDMLRVQRERVALALAVDGPAFTPMGRDERPLRDDYNGQDPYVVLSDLDQAAESLAAAFASMTAAELARTGTYNWPVTAARNMLWVGRHTVHETVHHLLDITRQR